MYSDNLGGESSGTKKQVEYYKKVEKTLTKTVIKDGNNPTSKKVVSTTIIKNGNNPEQVSKKVYTSSSNNQVSRRYEQNSQKNEPRKFKTGTSSSQYTKKVESSSNSKYTGLKPSSQTVNTSNKYSSRTTNQISKNAISSTNTYLANKSKANPIKNYGAGVKETRSHSTGNKEKFTYAGTVKEKENYMYYVSGVGYVTKEEAKKVEQEKAKSKPKPQPIMRSERTTIRIVTKKPEKKEGEKVENYEYHESKEVIDSKMDSLVIHRRGDPFYQIIGGKKKFSSYTSGARGKSNRIDDLSKDKTSTLKTDKYKTKTENKRTIIQTGKYKSTSTNKYQTKTQSITSAKGSQNSTKDKKKVPSKYTSTYQKTTKVEVSRKKYEPKAKYEKNFTEGNRGAKSSGMRNKNLPPSTKKYEEKTEDSYKKGKGPNNLNLNQKEFDTEKYKKELEEEQKNKDGLNGPDRFLQPSEENQGMDDANYCPIHGLKGHGNLGREGEMEIREENNQGVNPEFIDNYRFYESQKVTRKVENINKENMQNIIPEQNLNARNMVGQEQLMASGTGMELSQQMEGMSQQMQRMSQQMQRLSQQSQGINQQGLYGTQGMGVTDSQGCDYSKVYIATRAVPVYSEIVNQQFSNANASQVCNVCGNPFDQGLINNTQEIVYNNNGCPLHGQTMVQQQQFNGY